MPSWRTFLTGRSVDGTVLARGLPKRARDLIAAQEADSERLIGWVQLAVVVSFALLFALAPRPEDAPLRMLLEPVPIVLAIYFMFTLARLGLSYAWRLPGALLIVSILADIGLLLLLIWMFHEQYGQTPPFSLKVPTFIYMFVFIAIRALRFDHRYVLTAGLAAAVGWGGLVVISIMASGPDAITRSFVTHMNSNRILLGAEYDKIFAILLVTAVLTYAVKRGRALFVTAIRDEMAIRDLSRFFGRGVSDTVLSAETVLEAGMAEEREAAVIMLDIRGFTSIATRVPPRNAVELLTSLHLRILPIIRQHGGIIDKFLGDGIMVSFGAVQPTETAAADALRALEAVMVEARAWEATLPTHGLPRPIEVNGAAVSGHVVFAVLGALDRLEYTVIGQPVNLAAKLEKHNKVESTRALTTLETYQRAVQQGYSRTPAALQLSARTVAGNEGTIDLVVLASGRQ